MSATVPTTQTALVVKNKGPDYRLVLDTRYPVPVPAADELLVKLRATGVCHTDYSMVTNHWTGFEMQHDVAGHEGVGVVVGHGAGADQQRYPLGTRVGVTLIKNVCHQCESCLTPGGETQCDNIQLLTLAANGCFQQYTTVSASYAVPIPAALPDKYAGPLLCGGVTAYKGLKKAGLQAGEYVAVMGGAGGAGSMAVFFARCLGLRAIAIDLGADKRQSCLDNGAEHYVDGLATPDIGAEVHRLTGRGAHAVVVFPPSIQAYNQSFTVLGKRGVVVCIGMSNVTDLMAFPPAAAIFNDILIIGSMIGTRKDTIDALNLAARHKISFPVTEYPMEACPEILRMLGAGKVIGRAVLRFDQSSPQKPVL